MAIVTISENCTGCGACVKVCPQKILEVGAEKKLTVLDKGDTSKAALETLGNFIDPETESTLAQMQKSAKMPVDMSPEMIAVYCAVFSSMNYPTLYYGTKGQIVKMVLGSMLHHLPTLLRNPGIFKYL